MWHFVFLKGEKKMDGIWIVYKPKGITSHDVVKKVKHITGEKVGHAGTLDPNATGILPILVGKGTRLSSYIMNHDKTYLAVLKLGEKTDTADGEGNVRERKEVPQYTIDEIQKVLDCFLGEQDQVPPMYSAIKIKGKKLYEYARQQQQIEVSPRRITIFAITLLQYDVQKQQITFRVSCSKGTYIRTLCEDIAQKLETVGYMKELERIEVGNKHSGFSFSFENAITIEQLEQNIHHKEWINQHFVTIEMFFQEKQTLLLEEEQEKLVLNGGKMPIEKKEDIYLLRKKRNSAFIGIGKVENGFLKRELILEKD